MSGLKISLDAAMRARDVSRPLVSDQPAEPRTATEASQPVDPTPSPESPADRQSTADRHAAADRQPTAATADRQATADGPTTAGRPRTARSRVRRRTHGKAGRSPESS